MSTAPAHVIDRFEAVGSAPSVVTIGNFDGVHRGHQYLLKQVVERARELGVRSLVITFEPHPVSVLRPDNPQARIALPTTKVRRIAACGIDDVVVIPFDLEFASLGPREFLDLLRDHVSPREIIVGEGFRFGNRRAGDTDYIEQYAREHGFGARIIERKADPDGVVSSSRIRAALRAGDVTLAEELLGRRFRLSGVVERGFARGRELGYPTANLMVVGELIVPADGIYAGFVHIDDSDAPAHPALIYIGTTPTFETRERTVEAHILDFDADLYARNIEIEFVKFLRGDEKFDSVEALLDQIRQDEAQAREIFARCTPEPDEEGTT